MILPDPPLVLVATQQNMVFISRTRFRFRLWAEPPSPPFHYCPLCCSDCHWLARLELPHTVSTTSQTCAPQALIARVWNETPLKWMTFIKAVLRDRCLCWCGEHAASGGFGEHLTRRRSAWINSSAGFSFFREAPLRPLSRLQPPGCAPCSAPAPNILITGEIHLYVAIIVPNCYFEGERVQQHLADIWPDARDSDFVPSRKLWAWLGLYRLFSPRVLCS